MSGLKVVGLGGSLRQASRSRAALAVAVEGAAAAGATVELLDLPELALPIYRAVPYVVPVPQATRVFADSGAVTDEMVEQQLRLLGEEVVRVAERFARDPALHRIGECDDAAGRVVETSGRSG